MAKPTLRVLAVLELLQSHGQLSGAELARRVEVDPRTLRRYIAMLEDMGIPITTEQGRHGGYRLVPGYKLPPMMFTDEEAQALSLGLIAAARAEPDRVNQRVERRRAAHHGVRPMLEEPAVRHVGGDDAPDAVARLQQVGIHPVAAQPERGGQPADAAADDERVDGGGECGRHFGR